jgi:hypothetical protein
MKIFRMKTFLLFVLISFGNFPTVFCQTNDTIYVLLKLRGMDLVNEAWNKNHFVEQQIVSAVRKTSKKAPVRIISVEDTAQLGNLPYAYQIDLHILELRVNEPVVLQQNKSLSREVNTNNYSDEAEDLRKSHTTVYADFTQFEKTMDGLLRISISSTRVQDFTNIWTDVLVETFKWESQYGTYTGNFLALGTKEVQLSRTKPKPVPTQEQVFKDLIRQVLNKSSKNITDSFQ